MNNFNSNCVKNNEIGVILTVKLTPNASKSEIQGYTDEYIKIRVSAPPNENKANKKLLIFVSDFFNVPKSSVDLISGDKSRLKRICVKNISAENVIQKICIYDKIET